MLITQQLPQATRCELPQMHRESTALSTVLIVSYSIIQVYRGFLQKKETAYISHLVFHYLVTA